MQVDKQSDQNNIYYNLTHVNNTDIPIDANFNINRVDNILENPSDWVISIDEFKIPLYSIPLFQFNENEFSITLEYDGASVTEFLIYIPSGTGAIPVSGAIWDYQTFIRSTNIAFKKCYDALKILKPLMPANEPPFITLKENLLTLNAEEFYRSDLATPTNIFFNKKMYDYFTNLPTFFLSPDKIRYLINDTYTNGYIRGALNYYAMTQNTESISNWQQLNQILLETATIPVNKELIGKETDVQIQVISDYIIQADVNRPLPVFFKALGPIRTSELVSNYPMTNIDLRVRWFSTRGTSDVVKINAGESYTLKIVFTRKTHLDALNIDYDGINEI